MNVRVVRKKVPLAQWINGKWVNNVPWDMMIPEVKKQTDHIAVRKPGRKLGGVWIDELVAKRRQFNLCDNCYRKYIKAEIWWKTRNYLPLFYPRALIDCDGCGEFLFSAKMVPAEAPPEMARINFQEGAKIYVGT